MAPVFASIEAYDGGRTHDVDASRGPDGPLPIVGDYALNPIFEAIIDAAKAVGVPFNADYNSGDQDGISQEQITVRDGKRFNTYMAYVGPVAEKDTLTIRVGAQVERLVVRDGRVRGVELRGYDQPDAPEEGTEVPTELGAEPAEIIEADEVILCAGTIDSPKILMRSGIGPAEHLREVGIEVLLDAPGVGRNLHDHLVVPVIAEATAREIPHPETDWSVTQTHLFWRSRPGERLHAQLRGGSPLLTRRDPPHRSPVLRPRRTRPQHLRRSPRPRSAARVVPTGPRDGPGRPAGAGVGLP